MPTFIFIWFSSTLLPRGPDCYFLTSGPWLCCSAVILFPSADAAGLFLARFVILNGELSQGFAFSERVLCEKNEECPRRVVLCLHLPFASGIAQTWGFICISRLGTPHQVNSDFIKVTGMAWDFSLSQEPSTALSFPCHLSVVGFRLFSHLSLTLTLGWPRCSLWGFWPACSEVHHNSPLLSQALVSHPCVKVQTQSPCYFQVYFPSAAIAAALPPATLRVW